MAMNGDGERRLRRLFGPPASEGGTTSGPGRARSRFPRPSLRAGLAVAMAAALLVLAARALLATPHDHVALGCIWWTARTIDRLVPGDEGCVRGYAVVGGALAMSREPNDFRMSYLLAEPDQPVTRPDCPFGPGDAVVIRAHAIFDDGRTLLVVDDCR
jgi:hypothetical protein